VSHSPQPDASKSASAKPSLVQVRRGYAEKLLLSMLDGIHTWVRRVFSQALGQTSDSIRIPKGLEGVSCRSNEEKANQCWAYGSPGNYLAVAILVRQFTSKNEFTVVLGEGYSQTAKSEIPFWVSILL
jgi:hypothetical protein